MRVSKVLGATMVAGAANSTSVAEHAFHLMMALAKRGAALDAMVRKGAWGDRHAGLPIELSGKTVVIVLSGGNIGQATLRKVVCGVSDKAVGS